MPCHNNSLYASHTTILFLRFSKKRRKKWMRDKVVYSIVSQAGGYPSIATRCTIRFPHLRDLLASRFLHRTGIIQTSASFIWTQLGLPWPLRWHRPGDGPRPAFRSARSHTVSLHQIALRMILVPTSHLANFNSICPRRSACRRGPSLRDRRTARAATAR
jgi:hypothetical protein